MPMARAFPAFCLLFRHPSRATMLRDDRIGKPERSGGDSIYRPLKLGLRFSRKAEVPSS